MSFFRKLNMVLNPVGAIALKVAENVNNKIYIRKKENQEKEVDVLINLYKILKKEKGDVKEVLFMTAFIGLEYAKEIQLENNENHRQKLYAKEILNITKVYNDLQDTVKEYAELHNSGLLQENVLLFDFITDIIRIYENSSFVGRLFEKSAREQTENGLILMQENLLQKIHNILDSKSDFKISPEKIITPIKLYGKLIR